MDQTARGSLLVVTALALVFFTAGAGWAVHGEAIFLSAFMAGLAGCF